MIEYAVTAIVRVLVMSMGGTAGVAAGLLIVALFTPDADTAAAVSIAVGTLVIGILVSVLMCEKWLPPCGVKHTKLDEQQPAE